MITPGTVEVIGDKLADEAEQWGPAPAGWDYLSSAAEPEEDFANLGIDEGVIADEITRAEAAG